jgi:ubiquinone/menaquinone biosynthesis C-methylase UbiE
MDWVFEQMTLPAGCRVLEAGAGPGTLWEANRSRLPGSASVTLTDLSSGMVRTARESLGNGDGRFRFGVVDAQALPFSDGTFDVVIANHMLYHVPHPRRALGELARVLRTGGTFYATTVGEAHMRAMWRLLEPMVPDIMARTGAVSQGFTLENGAALLRDVFEAVERRDYEDALAITEVAPVLGYLDSSITLMDVALTDGQRQALADAIARRIEAEGVFRVRKASGLFVARKG